MWVAVVMPALGFLKGRVSFNSLFSLIRAGRNLRDEVQQSITKNSAKALLKFEVVSNLSKINANDAQECSQSDPGSKSDEQKDTKMRCVWRHSDIFGNYFGSDRFPNRGSVFKSFGDNQHTMKKNMVQESVLNKHYFLDGFMLLKCKALRCKKNHFALYLLYITRFVFSPTGIESWC